MSDGQQPDEAESVDDSDSPLTEQPTLPPQKASDASVDEATLPPRADGDVSGRDVDTVVSAAPGEEGAEAAAGTRVKYFGEYELLQEIARGGMGVVYKARQSRLNRIVALKMILSGQLASQEDVQRFYIEAEAAASLEHPGIVPIFEIGEYEGQHFFSMGFIDGESLDARVKEGPMLPREAAAITQQISEAIAYAHAQGVIHRDLKPANILIDASGDPKVTDFGLAKKTESDSGLTGTGQILGTPGYMPPEQASGETDTIGPAADIYSLGAILYALLTGRPPFQSANVMDTLVAVLEQEPVAPRQLNPGLDQDLETICLKCLEKDAGRRYATADELVAELGRYLNGEPIHARPIGKFERGWRWCKRKPALAGLSALAVLLLLLTLGIGGPLVALQQSALTEQARSGRARHQTVTADEPGLALKSTDVKAGNTDETVVQTSSGSPRDGNDVKPAVVLEALDPAPEFDGLKPILEQTTPLKTMLAVADSDRGKGRFEKQDKDGVTDLRGTFRFAKDWQADSLLRVEFGESPGQLDFSFWRGEHGVLFRHYPHSAISWAAYKVSRDGRNPDPNSFILLDTDSGIFKRIGSLRLEIRHQDGHLVAASLGRVLMVVPFPDPPEQVFLADTKARFQNIALERSGPIPIAQHEFPLHREINRPADEQWDTRLSEGSKVTPLDDGSIRLTAARPEGTAFVAMPFNHVGFHEVAFLIESPTPQTGVFLGTKHRRHPVGFFEETVRRKRVLEFAEGRSWQTTMKVDERLTPYIPDRVWVKIRAGVNAIGIWMSHDGKRWFLASAPIEHRHGALTEFGIYAAHGNTPRSITLKKVELRHLPTILQIADPELLAKTPSFARANNNHEWFRIAAAAIPEGVPLVEWRRACAVKALSQTPAVSLMSSLWAEVFRDGLTRPDWNHQQRQKFTREMFALMPLLKRWWPPSPFRTFEEVEHLRFHHGQPSLISTFTEAARTGDGTTIDRLDVMPYAALRLRMLDDFNRARLQDVHERSLAFRLGGRTLDWRHEQQHMNGFIEWLAPQVKRQIKTARLPMPVRNVDDVPFPAHPLQQAVNKETYNVFADLAGHLDAGDFGSAAEVVLQSSGKLATGLLPASDDTRLFVSSSQAITNATEQYAGLAEALDRSASLVQLRVSQAFAQQDWDKLRQIVHWFPGTSAAAQANRHLGDRTLAQGNFTVASQHFAEAMKVSAVAKRELRPRYYLAEAMAGRLNGLDLAAPDAELDLPDTVEFGGASMTRSEFLSLLADVQEAPPESPEHSVAKPLPVHSPCDISIASWGSEPFAGQQYANRRTAGTIHDGRLFVSDGMTIDCFNVTDGQLKWRRQFRSGDQADDLALTRLEPMMVGDALIARVETGAGRERPRQGPRLVRLDPLTGKTQHESRAGILTDPLQLNGMLFAITADVNLAAPHFALSAFDPLSLDELQRTSLLTSAPFFSRVQYPTFQVVHADGNLIATGAGCTLKVDLEGKVQWLRKHKWNPPRRFGRSWAKRGHPQPIVRAGRIYVTQPGTTEVECLELQSGKQIWRRTFDDPLAITRGLHGLVVATGRAIHCLNFENGKLVWMNNTPLVSPGHLVASGSNESAGTITFLCKAVIRNQRFIPAIAWLDSATGIELHRSLLGDTERQTPVVGAFISDGDRVWLPYAGDKSSGKMQLVELHTKPVNCVRLNAEYPLEDWDFYRDINISKAWKSMFPTWRLTMHRYDLKSDYRNELNGETSALITSMNRDWPTQIVREIKLPQGPCTLSMRVGHLGEPWTLSVRVNQQETHSQSIGETGKSGWVDVEVDLAPHTAKRIWLTIEANSESNNYACWKRLALEVK